MWMYVLYHHYHLHHLSHVFFRFSSSRICTLLLDRYGRYRHFGIGGITADFQCTELGFSNLYFAISKRFYTVLLGHRNLVDSVRYHYGNLENGTQPPSTKIPSVVLEYGLPAGNVYGLHFGDGNGHGTSLSRQNTRNIRLYRPWKLDDCFYRNGGVLFQTSGVRGRFPITYNALINNYLCSI